MTDLAALDALIDAVTAGEVGDDGFCPLFHQSGFCVEMMNAYDGSLDAAHAMHETLLPGWAWSIEVANAAEVWPSHKASVAVRAFADEATPARAWLLAILKAYRAGL